MKALLFTPFFFVAVCTVCYEDAKSGLKVCEPIDGKINGSIEIPSGGLELPNGDKLTIDRAK